MLSLHNDWLWVLYLLLSAAEENPSEDNWTRHQSVSIAEYHSESFHHFIDFIYLLFCAHDVWFYHRAYPVSSSWPSKQSQSLALSLR